jgi:GTP-binding protein
MHIIDARFLKSLTKAEDRKGISLPEICFVGRSNVGKSSLLNALVARKIARTGSTPGATRLINLYGVRSEKGGRRNEMVFSDFPGFGYSKVSKGVYENWQAMVEGYMTGNEWIRRVLWAFDIRRSFDGLDRMLLEWLRDNGLAFSLVLTKADKEGRDGRTRARLSFQRLLGIEEVFPFSTKDGSGRRDLLDHIGNILR